MPIDAALYSVSRCFFFRGNRYIRVTRGSIGPGTVDTPIPAPISNWRWPDGFGSNGIDAALYSGTKFYFFRGDRYVRVTRGGDIDPGTVDPGYPAPISNWRWPDGFGSNGIDAALYSRTKCYFFRGNEYVRVTRGDTGPGTVDPGYPAPISNWWWPDGFGSNGIDAALFSRSRCYFFQGDRYVRVTRGDTGPGTVDHGYPRNIRLWEWPDGFAQSPEEEPQTARIVAVSCRIPLVGGGTEPSFGTVDFRGNLSNPEGSAGVTSFDRGVDWEALPGVTFGLATFGISNLRVGRWRIEARTPVWAASCDVNLEAGANNNVNFQQSESGCARGFSFPVEANPIAL